MTTIALSVSAFKAHCLETIRQVEQAGASVNLTRHGKTVARLVPTLPMAQNASPWMSLRNTGVLRARPEESGLVCYQGVSVEIQTGAEVVARLTPPAPVGGYPLERLADLLVNLPTLGKDEADAFLPDIDAANAQLTTGTDPWDSRSIPTC